MRFLMMLIAVFALAVGVGGALYAQHNHTDKDHSHAKDADNDKGEWDAEVKTDLKNEIDPVNDEKVTDADAFTAVWHGFKAHFQAEESLKKFKARPYAFAGKLGLEMDKDMNVTKVDLSTVKEPPVMPASCPIMDGDITPEDDIFIIHRGYKFYFCCWMGCHTKFLANPAKYYGTYGLMEKDGKLVPKAEGKTEVAEWDAEVKTDLKNETDPVNGEKVTDADAFTAVWYGFKAHFQSEKSLKKFKARPYQYSAKLSLSMDGLGDIKKVDASTFKLAAAPDTCLFCSEEIDTAGDVYILHRGFKIYFGCWMGCWKKFLTDPAKYYDSYGLVDKDGKLMLKTDAEKKDDKKGDSTDK